MKFLTLDNCHNLKGKRVLVRIDVNSPILNHKIQDNERIREHSRTLGELVRKKAKVIVIAHQGRPKQSDFTSLKQHAKLLSRYCGQRVYFVDDIIGHRAINSIRNLKSGQILLLENLRYLEEENKELADYRNTKLIKIFGPLFDLYVFDAFSVSHRNSASVNGLGRIFPIVAGRVMEKELRNLSKLDNLKRPYIFILGGDKPDDLVRLIEARINNVDYILTGGILAELFLMAKGFRLGAKETYIRRNGYDKVLSRLKKFANNRKIITPYDLAFDKKGKRLEFNLKWLPNKYLSYDIGSLTILNYKIMINKAKTIYFKGPLGHYEKKNFDLGTKEILKSVVKSKAFSIVGGGHSLDAVEKYVGKNKIGYVSLAGGALLEYMAGEKLPGLEILTKKHHL